MLKQVNKFEGKKKIKKIDEEELELNEGFHYETCIFEEH